MKGARYRLKIIVNELETTTVPVEYQIALLSFINCLINATQGLRERIRIRNEFIGKCIVMKDNLFTLLGKHFSVKEF